MTMKKMKTLTIKDTKFEIVDEAARNAIEQINTVDDTLSISGQAADAKATGDAISSLSEENVKVCFS